MTAFLLYIPDAPLRLAVIASALLLVAQLGGQWWRAEVQRRTERERAFWLGYLRRNDGW